MAALAILGLSSRSANAVIVAHGDGRNLAPPPQPYLDVWNLQGQFGQFLATPISDRHIITAAHTSNVARPFTYRGHTYSLQATPINVPDTDLRIWTLDTSIDSTLFPAWASMYDQTTDGDETGKEFVIFGRGMPRGSAIYAPINPGPTLAPVVPATSTASSVMTLTSGGTAPLASPPAAATLASAAPIPAAVPDELRGWKLNAYDGQQSWGRNTVDAIETTENFGDLLIFDFDRADHPEAIANEAGLAPFDSGGGVFIQANGVWKLAAVNLGSDLTYAASPEGLFDPSWPDGIARNVLTDLRGLYTLVADGPDDGTDPDIVQLGYSTLPVAPVSYSSRISSSRDYILSQLGITAGNSGGFNGVVVPEPMGGIVAALITGMLAATRRRR